MTRYTEHVKYYQSLFEECKIFCNCQKLQSFPIMERQKWVYGLLNVSLCQNYSWTKPKYVFKHIVRTVGVSKYVGSRDRCKDMQVIYFISCIVKLMILWSLFQRYFANLTCTLTWRLWRFVGQVNDASALLLKCMFWISIHQIRAEKNFFSMTCRSCNKNTQNAFIVDG